MSSGVTASCMRVSLDFPSALFDSDGRRFSRSGITEYLSSEAFAKFPVIFISVIYQLRDRCSLIYRLADVAPTLA